MSRRFRHRNEDWEAESTGTGHGAGFGHVPAITSWGIKFTSISHPETKQYFGSGTKADVGQLTEHELQASLDAAIAQAVLNALEDPRWDWRTVEGLSEETGLPEDEVRRILESDPDEIIRSRTPDKGGRTLYTSRSIYKGRRGFLDSFRST